MRFGSDSLFDARYSKYKDISQTLNIKESTLGMIIKKFKDNGNTIARSTRQGTRKLSYMIIKYITDRDTLK
jgi:hypothetical protein